MAYAIIRSLQGTADALWSFAASRIGQIIIAAALAYGVAHVRENAAWEARVASQDARMRQARADELARDAAAAQESAVDATARAENDAAAAEALQRQIEDLKAVEADYVPQSPNKRGPASHPCGLDDDFARRVRDLDDAGHRTPTPPQRPRGLR